MLQKQNFYIMISAQILLTITIIKNLVSTRAQAKPGVTGIIITDKPAFL